MVHRLVHWGWFRPWEIGLPPRHNDRFHWANHCSSWSPDHQIPVHVQKFAYHRWRQRPPEPALIFLPDFQSCPNKLTCNQQHHKLFVFRFLFARCREEENCECAEGEVSRYSWIHIHTQASPSGFGRVDYHGCRRWVQGSGVCHEFHEFSRINFR